MPRTFQGGFNVLLPRTFGTFVVVIATSSEEYTVLYLLK